MSKDQIEAYLKKNIEQFIFEDIKNCIHAKANYTIALALTSYTDFLGGLINGTLGLQGKSKEQFNKALEYFEWNGDANYYKDFRITYRDVDFTTKSGDIFSLFRCGLAHEYFIKGDSFVHNNPDGYRDENGVSYSEGCVPGEAGIQIINENGRQRLRFHTNAYFRDFKQACTKYCQELKVDNNEALREKFMNARERISVREIKFNMGN